MSIIGVGDKAMSRRLRETFSNTVFVLVIRRLTGLAGQGGTWEQSFPFCLSSRRSFTTLPVFTNGLVAASRWFSSLSLSHFSFCSCAIRCLVFYAVNHGQVSGAPSL